MSWKTPSILAAIVASCALAHGSPIADLQDKPKPNPNEEVRIRITQVRFPVALSGVGLRFPGRTAKSPQTSGLSAVKIRWSPVPDGLYEWTIEDRDSGAQLAKVKARALGLVGQKNRVNLRAVPERLTIRPTGRRAADLIATMDLESYVSGVLPAEMPVSWPLEALKAQAIAARSFALWRKAEREKAGAPYHLESNVMDQVFLMPLASESQLERHASAERAVRETKGIILQDKDTEPLAAFFHADCGGRTDEPMTVWGYGKKNGVAIDRSCPLNPIAKWRVELTGEEIARAIRAGGAVSSAEPVTIVAGLEIGDRLASGRVQTLALTWSDGTSSQISAHQFRMSLGYDRVKSTNFQLARTPEGKFELAGQGYGHGVGLCQWGAKHLASKGMAFREILKHYYPRANLQIRSDTSPSDLLKGADIAASAIKSQEKL